MKRNTLKFFIKIRSKKKKKNASIAPSSLAKRSSQN